MPERLPPPRSASDPDRDRPYTFRKGLRRSVHVVASGVSTFEPLTVGVDPDPPVIQNRAPVTRLAGYGIRHSEGSQDEEPEDDRR